MYRAWSECIPKGTNQKWKSPAMAKLLYGPRIAAGAPLMLGCLATLFDVTGEKVLLTQRGDNGQWVLPGGALQSGESLAEACAREMLEETGVTVRVMRLLGVYSDPDMLVTYTSGARYHLITHNFLVTSAGGEPSASDEVTAWGWYGPDDFDSLALMPHHRQRLADAYARQMEAFIR
jgi:ADP-ribose pyrophosphatase YjhB (NUDIX family)